MKIAFGQINPTVGDIRGNTNLIIETIQQVSKKSDILVFPEMALTGYPPQDLLYESHFIDAVESAILEIASYVNNQIVILGAIRSENNYLFNTAVIMQDGHIIGYRDKSLLPTYDVFDETRYFTPAPTIKPIEVNINSKPVLLGVEICEDMWDDAYSTKVSQQLSDQGSEIIINISASPFHVNRIKERIDIASSKAKDLKQYFIYCNLVGAQDELVFDGQSFALNSKGELITLCSAFSKEISIIDLGKSTPIQPKQQSENEQIYHALTLGVKDYFSKTNHSTAVIGLSGGIDSALTACIAKNALGADNVIGVSMPSIYSSDHSISDAELLANNLGIQYEILPIKNLNEEFLKQLDPFFSDTEPGLAEENLQARIRGNLLMAVANKKNALVLNTGNKTETALGYCTMYGDMAGAIGVISDLNKTQVYAVSHWINQYFKTSIIPEGTLTKPPSAELRPNQVDPFDYDVISPLVDKIITDRKHAHSLIEEGADSVLVFDLLRKIRFAEFKRRQSPPGIRVSSKAFGVGRRYPIVNQFTEK
jgi:NAD+ synthase (glutamine-hydrolysing)